MRVRVDPDRCQGHARCWVERPDVFELDDDGYCAILEVAVPPSLEASVRRAAGACPELAITVIDDQG
jgi:ferredoxin